MMRLESTIRSPSRSSTGNVPRCENAAAPGVAQDSGRAAGRGGVAIAPVHQLDEHGPQRLALVGEVVALPHRALAIRAALEDLLLDEPLEPRGEHVARDAQLALLVIEAV